MSKATAPASDAPKRPPVDMEALERDYRTGHFTDRELGAKYGRSHTMVAKWARKNGWQKDLEGAVRAATAAKVAEAEVAKVASAEVAKAVSKQVARAIPATTEVVAALAEVNSQVILRHRDELRTAREEVMALWAELRQAALLPEHAELLAEILAGEGASTAAANKARETVHRAISLAGRIGAANQLTQALTRLHEREDDAFGITERDRNPNPGNERTSIPIVFVDAPYREVGRE